MGLPRRPEPRNEEAMSGTHGTSLCQTRVSIKFKSQVMRRTSIY